MKNNSIDSTVHFDEYYNDNDVQDIKDIISDIYMGKHYMFNKNKIYSGSKLFSFICIVMLIIYYLFKIQNTFIGSVIVATGMIAMLFSFFLYIEKKYHKMILSSIFVGKVRHITLLPQRIIINDTQYEYTDFDRILICEKFYLLFCKGKNNIIKRTQIVDNFIYHYLSM